MQKDGHMRSGLSVMDNLNEMKAGFETAYIDSNAVSNLAYKPQFLSNDYKEGKKVLSSIEDELWACDQFQISVAFITLGGIRILFLQIWVEYRWMHYLLMKDLERWIESQ